MSANYTVPKEVHYTVPKEVPNTMGPPVHETVPKEMPNSGTPMAQALSSPGAKPTLPQVPPFRTKPAVPMAPTLGQASARFDAPAGQEWYHGHGEDLNAPGVQFDGHAHPNNLLSTALYLLNPNRPSQRMLDGLRTPPPTPWYSGSPSAPSAPYLQPGSPGMDYLGNPGMGYPGNVSQMDAYQRQQAAQMALMGLPL